MSIVLSPSRLKTYAQCPKQYHWHYNLKLLQPFNKAFIIGTKYHHLVEKFHRGEPVNVVDDEHKEILTRLIDKYKKNPVKGVVVDTEKRFSITEDGITINGVIDRIDTDKIVEYKTSSFDYTNNDIDSWQTDLYIWWLEKITGIIYPMVYSVINKTKAKTIKYVPQILTVTKTKDELLLIGHKLKNTAQKIENGEFNETPGEHCAYCPYGSGFNGTMNCKYTYVKPKKKK